MVAHKNSFFCSVTISHIFTWSHTHFISVLTWTHAPCSPSTAIYQTFSLNMTISCVMFIKLCHVIHDKAPITHKDFFVITISFNHCLVDNKYCPQPFPLCCWIILLWAIRNCFICSEHWAHKFAFAKLTAQRGNDSQAFHQFCEGCSIHTSWNKKYTKHLVTKFSAIKYHRHLTSVTVSDFTFRLFNILTAIIY